VRIVLGRRDLKMGGMEDTKMGERKKRERAGKRNERGREEGTRMVDAKGQTRGKYK
jgi:hypothetical protein